MDRNPDAGTMNSQESHRITIDTPRQEPKPLDSEPAEKGGTGVNVKTMPRPKSKPKSIATLESEIAATEAQLAATLSQLAEARSRKAGRQNAGGSSTTPTTSKPTSNATAITSAETALDGSSTRTPLGDDQDDHNQQQQDQRQELLTHAQGIFEGHIALLRRYNDTKDIAMGMLSVIADRQGKRLAEVMAERGVDGEED